jgi:hypothetical protein
MTLGALALAAGCGVVETADAPCTSLDPDPNPAVVGAAFTVRLRCDVAEADALRWSAIIDYDRDPFARSMAATPSVADDILTLTGTVGDVPLGAVPVTIVAFAPAGTARERLVTETWLITAAGR